MKHTKLKALLVAGVATAMSATSALAYTATASVSLNVRAGAGTHYAVIDVLRPGEPVDVRSCNSYGWCYITHPGPDGWVSARYLSDGYSRPYYREYRNDNSDAALLALPFLFALPFVLNNDDHHHHRRPHRHWRR